MERRLYMATKSSNLYVRIEPEVKEKAESILATLGISVSSAINMFYKQIILQKGIPFDGFIHQIEFPMLLFRRKLGTCPKYFIT